MHQVVVFGGGHAHGDAVHGDVRQQLLEGEARTDIAAARRGRDAEEADGAGAGIGPVFALVIGQDIHVFAAFGQSSGQQVHRDGCAALLIEGVGRQQENVHDAARGTGGRWNDWGNGMSRRGRITKRQNWVRAAPLGTTQCSLPPALSTATTNTFWP